MPKQEKSVSEIIAGALEIFKGGKAWNNGSLHMRRYDGGQEVDTYCALGGLSKAATGRTSYSSRGNLGKAKKLVASFVPRSYGIERGNDIPTWNDSLSDGGFHAIKRVFCKALKASMKGPVKSKSKVSKRAKS